MQQDTQSKVNPHAEDQENQEISQQAAAPLVSADEDDDALISLNLAEQAPLSPEEKLAQLEKQLAEAQEELETTKDQLLRAAADAQNTRRRAEIDIAKAHTYGLEKFARELLPVIDSLEKAAAAMSNADAAHKEGVEMTLNLFLTALGKAKITQINPLNEEFNPQLHEAMSQVPNPSLPNNSVMDVIQTGYQINDRLLRAAMVIVATGGDERPKQKKEEDKK